MAYWMLEYVVQLDNGPMEHYINTIYDLHSFEECLTRYKSLKTIVCILFGYRLVECIAKGPDGERVNLLEVNHASRQDKIT